MNAFRQDLTKWALHFIHDYNPVFVPGEQVAAYETFYGFPYHENREIDTRFDDWRIKDIEHFPSGYEPSAFEILLKILTDGHIRTTWAFRKGRPTIYGPRAAACFTEMPLYALIEYAKTRSIESVGPYAIAVPKEELFRAGARPVIYGLSGIHREQTSRDSENKGWPRKLESDCGISEKEQFRYVAMSHEPGRIIDWSHEREWRWVDHLDQCSCPGIPIWLADEPFSFSEVYVVVPSNTEVEPVLNLLRELYDTGQNDYFHQFCRRTLKATSVIALDQLEAGRSNQEMRSLRLEEVPSSSLNVFERPEASTELVEKVRAVLDEAKEAADHAALEFLSSAQRTQDGKHIADVAGWASLVIADSQSPLVSALQKLDSENDVSINTIAGIGYIVPEIGGLGWGNEQALSIAEEAVRAAKRVFENHFPEVFFRVRTRWD